MPEDKLDLIPVGEDEKPEAVAQAERTIRHLAFGLTSIGVVGSVLWYLHVLLSHSPLFYVPLTWVALFLVALIVFFFFPQTRKARFAREILRQWDEAQVKGLLEASGSSTDPRLQSAEKMGQRIARHPGATPQLRGLAGQLVERLRRTTQDERLLEVLIGSRTDRRDDAPAKDSLRDSLDYLEARAGSLLGALAELHAVVVKRDEKGIDRVLAEAERTLSELEALDDVERLLTGEDG